MKIAQVDLLYHGLTALQTKVDELNKRAARHGLEPITLHTNAVQFIRVLAGHFLPAETLYRVEIHGVEPRIDGWQMVAKIEFDSEIGIVVKQLPGVEQLDPKYRTTEPVCEHCGTTRKRKDVFVLRNGDEEKIVGRNCLADFIRSGDAEKLAEWALVAQAIAEWSDSDSEAESESDRGCYRDQSSGIALLTYLTYTSAVIRKWGWVSRSRARDTEDTSTCTWVANCFGRNSHKFIFKNDLFPNEYDHNLAEKALEWARTKAGDQSEYLNTIGKLAQHDELVWKYDGYTASILSAYLKEMDLLEARKRKPPRVFLGEPKQRLRAIPAQVLRMRYVEGQFGTKTIITFEHKPDESSRAVLTWFGSGDLSNEYAEGDLVAIDATIKAHESDAKYGDSTIIQRVKRCNQLN